MSTQGEPVWRTVHEVADLFQSSVRTVRMWVRRGHVTLVDDRLDLVQVLDWWDHRRDTRMAAVRQGLAQTATPCNHDRGRPHTQNQVTTPVLSLVPDTLPSVESDVTFVANGTVASLAGPYPERDPQLWDGIIRELPPGQVARIGSRYHYLTRLGIAVNQELFDRMVALEREDSATAARFPIGHPTTVYYVRVGQLIKIGQTVDLATRLRAYPPGSVLLATEIGERDELEGQRLDQFRLDRAHRREWFHASAALVTHINSLREQPLTPAELAA